MAVIYILAANLYLFRLNTNNKLKNEGLYQQKTP
jgi:hypothetical protein